MDEILARLKQRLNALPWPLPEGEPRLKHRDVDTIARGAGELLRLCGDEDSRTVPRRLVLNAAAEIAFSAANLKRRGIS